VTWLWVAGMLIPFGLATPILFGIAGVQTRKVSWMVAAVVYAIVSWGGVALAVVTEDESDGAIVAGLMIIVAWVAGPIHALFARPEYARRLNAGPTPLEVARKALAERREAQRLARIEPQAALEMGVGRPEQPGAVHMGVVDVNNADAKALLKLPGITRALAREIETARVEIDGFESVEDLGTVLRLSADAVEDLRPYVVFLPR
jgi:hypothetical protein